MLFGLRQSTQHADFDFLIQLRAATTGGLIQKHIDAALNHIAGNLRNQSEISVDNPDYWHSIKTREERLSDSIQLGKEAAEAEKTLESKGLRNNALFFLY